MQEHLTQSGGQLIDQTADAQILIVDDGALGVKHLAHLDGHLGLLIGPGQIPDMAHHGAHAHNGLDSQLPQQGLLDVLGDLVHVPGVGVLAELLDQGHVGLAEGEDEVGLTVGVQVGHHIHGGHVWHTQLAHQQDHPGHLGDEVQLLGPDIDVAQEDVVGQDVLDKGSLVVLLLIIGLGTVERDGGHGAHGGSLLIFAPDKGGIVKLTIPTGHGLKGEAVAHHHVVPFGSQQCGYIPPLLTNVSQFVTCQYGALLVDDSDGSVGAILHLENDALENAAGHCAIPFPGSLTLPTALFIFTNDIISVYPADFNSFF